MTRPLRDNSRNSILSIVGGLIVGVLLLVSFGIDYVNVSRGGSVDLRNRITGARLLERGIDPYHYKWHEDQPPEYIDLRNTSTAIVSKTTVTPSLLTLQLPFAPLPYRLTQFLWLGVQWLLLLGAAWLWWRESSTTRARGLVALFVTGFTYTQAWRWQAERGQAYVLLVFLLAWWLTSMMDAKRGNGFIAGCVAGFLVALRPPALLLLPFLALHRRGQIPGATAGLLFGFGLPLLMRPTCWSNYFAAMDTYSDLYRQGINPPHVSFVYPATIEGMSTDLLGQMMPFRTGDFSMHSLFHWLGLAPFPALPPLIAVVGLFIVWLWLFRKQSVERLLPGLAAWFFLTDLFLPAIRFSYHDVFILNVVLVGVVTAKRFPCAAWPCVLALPLGWGVYYLWPTAPWVLNLPAFFFTLGAIGFLFSSLRKQEAT